MIIKLFSFLAMAIILSLSATKSDKKQEKVVIIKLTVTQANIALKGISKLSIEEGQETYMVILTQANQQLQDTLIPKKK